MVVDVLVTKEDADLFSGSSCYYAAVVATMVSAAETTAVEMTVSGSSSFYSAVADVAITTDAAVAASSYKLDHRSKKKGYRRCGTLFLTAQTMMCALLLLFFLLLL